MKKIYRIKAVTLIELLVTVAIIGILAMVATYLYSQQALKGRRIDAINTLLSISLAEERYRSNNTTYGTLAQVWNGVSTTPEGYYTISISNVGAGSYTITATATGNQVKDSENGTSCTSLVLSESNGTIAKTPSSCFPT